MALRWQPPIHETAHKHGVREADIGAALRTVVYENEQPHGTTIATGSSSMPCQLSRNTIDDYRDHRR